MFAVKMVQALGHLFAVPMFLLCLQKIPIWRPFVCGLTFFVAIIFKVVLNMVPAAHHERISILISITFNHGCVHFSYIRLCIFLFHSVRGTTRFEADAWHPLGWVYREKPMPFFVCVLSAPRRNRLSQCNVDQSQTTHHSALHDLGLRALL